jgi:threonine/homoserine efflux transporter RhtA
MRAPRFPISKELAVILGALLLMLFVTPVTRWWADAELHWTAPYGLWLLVIIGSALIYRRDDTDEP